LAGVATLYDVHGSLAALEAVPAEIPDEATIVVGGDVCAGCHATPRDDTDSFTERTPEQRIAFLTERGL